jgi:hypothetical protein
MSEHLLEAFNQGRKSRRNSPRNHPPSCPYTNGLGDAWHVGYEFERTYPHANMVDDVRSLEGRRVVVRLGAIHKNPDMAPCAVYGINHTGPYLIGQA